MADEIVVDNRPWWKKKSVQTAIIGGIIAALEAAGISAPPYVIMALSAFGVYAIQDRLNKPLGK